MTLHAKWTAAVKVALIGLTSPENLQARVSEETIAYSHAEKKEILDRSYAILEFVSEGLNKDIEKLTETLDSK